MSEHCRNQLRHIVGEVEEMAIQLADMLGAALHYAGVPDEKMPLAVEAYLNLVDELFESPERMGYEEIVKVIDYMQERRSELFR
ncbi:MAG: hypothetical protein GXO19_05070 [Epsilonproteobacteria bacterium]|nr:hypothetical protein [Campylobacterota bacterium]NPA57089.1 hypothetical protein [Campylobacterota bacterium]